MKKNILLIFLFALTAGNAQNAANFGLQSRLWEEYDNGEWRNRERQTYAEDENGYLQNIDLEKWDNESTAWVFQGHTIYTVNDIGNITQFVSQYWNNQTQTFINTVKDEYLYDENKISYVYDRYWQDNVWNNYWKFSYGYDAAGFLTWKTREDWGQNAYNNTFKELYTNDSAGKLMQTIGQAYSINGWYDFERYTYVYNEDGNVTQILYDQDQLQTGTWELTHRIDISYNAQGRKAVETYSYISNGDWIPYMRYTYGYDVLAVGNPEREDFAVWPNPAADRVRVSGMEDIKAVSIYATDGRKCLSQISGDAIDVSTLARGIYVLQVVGSEDSKTVKFVKE